MRVAWVAFWTLSLDVTLFHFFRMAPGLVADQLGQDLALSGADLGLVLSMFFYIYGALQIPAGLIVDAFGTRWVVAAGLAVSALGQFLFGWSDLFWVLVLGRIITGLGIAGIFVAMSKGIAQLFPADRFATVYGFSSSVHNTGALLATVPLAAVVGWLGWRGAMISIAVLAAAAGLASWYALPRELEPTPGPGEHVVNCAGLRAGLRQVVRQRGTWLAFLIFAGVYSPYLAFTGMWGIPFLMARYGMDRSVAAQQMMWFGISPIFFTPLLGYLSDRVLRSRRAVLFPVTVLGVTLWGILAISPGAIQGWSLGPFLLLLSGTCTAFGLAFAVGRELNPLPVAGLALGVVNTGSYVGVSLLQAAIGWLLDSATGGRGGSLMTSANPQVLTSYQWAAGLSALCFLLAFAVVLFLPETHPARKNHGLSLELPG